MAERRCPKIDAIQASAVSRFFSSNVIRQLGKYSRSPLFARLAKESGLVDRVPEGSIARFLDDAFDALDQPGYRNEHVYRSALLHKVLLGRHSLNTATMLTEFRVANCRADVVILNGTSIAYEVKSERDDLQRLEAQVDAYRRAFAQVNVVADEWHVSEVLDIVPKDVGVLRISDRRTISVVRKSIDAPYRVQPAVIFDSLRRSEADAILRSCGIEVPKVPNTEAYGVLKELFLTLSPSQAHEGMVVVLNKTRSLIGLSSFLEGLPRSLQASALFVPLNQRERHRLIDAMGVPMSMALSWA